MWGHSGRIQWGFGARLDRFGSGNNMISARSNFSRLLGRPAFLGPVFCNPGGGTVTGGRDLGDLLTALEPWGVRVIRKPGPESLASRRAMLTLLHEDVRGQDLTDLEKILAISPARIDEKLLIILGALIKGDRIKHVKVFLEKLSYSDRPQEIHTVVFDEITKETISDDAKWLRTFGATLLIEPNDGKIKVMDERLFIVSPISFPPPIFN